MGGCGDGGCGDVGCGDVGCGDVGCGGEGERDCCAGGRRRVEAGECSDELGHRRETEIIRRGKEAMKEKNRTKFPKVTWKQKQRYFKSLTMIEVSGLSGTKFCKKFQNKEEKNLSVNLCVSGTCTYG